MNFGRRIRLIQVIVGNELKQEVFYVSPSTTPREFLDELGIDYIIKSLRLNNGFLSKKNIDKTFSELGIIDKCSMLEVA